MGEVSDFEEWYRIEQPEISRALWVMSGDRETAADATDEAFSRALARWDRVSVMASPGGWVRTVAVNRLRRTMRRRDIERRLLRRQPPAAPVQPEFDPDLWRAVAELPYRQREVIALRYVDDLTESDIAASLGISEGSVSASLTKARRRLGEILNPEREVTRS